MAFPMLMTHGETSIIVIIAWIALMFLLTTMARDGVWDISHLASFIAGSAIMLAAVLALLWHEEQTAPRAGVFSIACWAVVLGDAVALMLLLCLAISARLEAEGRRQELISKRDLGEGDGEP